MLSSSETSVQITNALEKLIDSGISLGERVLGCLLYTSDAADEL